MATPDFVVGKHSQIRIPLEYRTDRRGYTMWLERDLFGAFVLYRRWYGLHNRRGGMKRQVFEREQDALREVRRIMCVRERHGYVPVGQ